MNKAIWALLIFLLGTGFGYWWRAHQTDPIFAEEIRIIQTLNHDIRSQMAAIDGRLMALETITKNGKGRRK